MIQSMTPELRASSTVLIVDDTPANLHFLLDYLTGLRFKVLVAPDGEQALEQLDHVMPDLILLDIMMPGMDGFETCRRIKSNPGTRDIPVIFMTALVETEHKLRGFAAGAVDYVSKPLSPEEVLARVDTHLAIRRLQRELEQRNQELRGFASMLAHDVRGSVGGIIDLTNIIIAANEGQSVVHASRHDIELIHNAGQRVQDTLQAMLLLSRFEDMEEAVELVPLDMSAVLTRVLKELDHRIRERNAVVMQPERWPVVLGVGPWVERIWSNYIENALKYGGNPPAIELGASIDDRTGRARFWVRDNGSGVPTQERERIFQPFVRLQPGEADGYGLGLSIVKRIASRLRGEVGVRTPPRGGAEFYFELTRA